MSTVFEVRSISKSSNKLHSFGSFLSRDEAEVALAKRFTGENSTWAEKHHERWWIEEIDTTGLFEIPSKQIPRERFSTRVKEIKRDKGWQYLHVDVVEQNENVVYSYQRNYPNMFNTFEPFRQNKKLFALISSDYTATSVIDLKSGVIIASEEPDSLGFCPVGFYVPDWWDIHSGRTLPGTHYWKDDDELPKGDFGFVWGCEWGDDSSWKIQVLDLSKIQQGKITRDERFGYVELASHPKLEPKDFIKCYFRDGKCEIVIHRISRFDLDSGDYIPHEFEVG